MTATLFSLTEGEDSLRKEHPARPPKFDPWRIAATPAMQNLVAEAVEEALRMEQVKGLRKRARRPEDDAIFRGIIEALVCNATYQYLRGHRAVRITRSKRLLAKNSRYNSELLSKQLPAILDLLSEHLSILTQTLGSHSAMHSHQTEIAVGPWLHDKLRWCAFDISDTMRKPGEEIVLLKGEKVDGLSPFIEYDDTEHTNAIRAEVREINEWLASADIEFHERSKSGLLVDPQDRYLRRYFSRGSWFSGGRLFGGFWQPIGKQERLENLLIDGESVVSLDYVSMAAALAYAYVGEKMPEGDAYEPLTVYAGRGEAVTLKRGTVKKLLNSMLFVDKPLGGRPRGVDLRGAPLGAVLSAIEARHAAIAPLFYRGMGHTLQYSESSILVDVLLRLKDAGIHALPVHDCVVVAEGHTEAARRIMQDTFRFHMKADVGVACESAE